eukprot:TRINITY_DN3538_c0_g1_i12.p1 TRINITY_DN3538_c0_g1~~TRINITY_DN3538_c0_g1_i12.p1  ORF type:complete len:538 (-),score=155.88 TRINITY_DN3538_c0_g1_i12:95-1708(-)
MAVLSCFAFSLFAVLCGLGAVVTTVLAGQGKASIQVKQNEHVFFGCIGFVLSLSAAAVDSYTSTNGGRTQFGVFEVRRDNGLVIDYKEDCPISFPLGYKKCDDLEQGGAAVFAFAFLTVLVSLCGLLFVKFKPGGAVTVAWGCGFLFAFLAWVIWIAMCDDAIPSAELTELGSSTLMMIFASFALLLAAYLSSSYEASLPFSLVDNATSVLGFVAIIFLVSALAVDRWSTTAPPNAIYFGSFALRQGDTDWDYDSNCAQVLANETCNDLDDGGSSAFAFALLAILATLAGCFFAWKSNAKYSSLGFGLAALCSFLSFIIWITVGADDIGGATDNGTSFVLTVTAAFVLLIAFVLSLGGHSFSSGAFTSDPKGAVYLVAILLDVTGYFMFLYAMNGGESDQIIWHSWLSLAVAAIVLGVVGFGVDKKYEYLAVLLSLICIVPLSGAAGGAGVRAAGLHMQLIAMYLVVGLPWVFGEGPGGLKGKFGGGSGGSSGGSSGAGASGGNSSATGGNYGTYQPPPQLHYEQQKTQRDSPPPQL